MTDQSSDEDSVLNLRISPINSDEGSENEELDSEGSDNDELLDRETGTESENGNNPESQSSTEWVEFNKKVISMRPLFKSAKVQFIHKASRSIKILRKKKGTPEQVEKNTKKADRLAQEISYINRLKKDVISKFALLHSKEEVTKIVNDASSTMEYRVKAKLASTPKISKAANDYHETHPDWRESLFKLIQLAGKNMKKKRRKIRGKTNRGSVMNEENRQNAKKQSKKFQDDNDIDSERFGVSNFPEAPPELEEPDEEESVGGSEEDDDESEDQSEEDSDGESLSNLNLRASNPNFKSTLPQITKLKKSHENVSKDNVQKLASIQKDFTKLNKKGGMAGSGKMNGDEQYLFETESDNVKRHISDNSSDEDVSKPDSQSNTNVDPFFMTSDNKEYKTLWKVEPADSFKNKKPNEPEFMFKNARPYKDVLSGKNKNGPPKAKVARMDRAEKKNVGGNKQQAQIPIEKLHPSWQAKKKMSAVAFQGKKVVFDD